MPSAALHIHRRNHETEVKISCPDLRKFKRNLREAGFRLTHPRALEDNFLFDTPNRDLRLKRSLLRLRRYGSQWFLTFKGTPAPDPHYKSRLELELEIQQPREIALILQALGFHPVFRYQKFRSLYAASHSKSKSKPHASVEVFVDETPIGNYLELEGSRSSIDQVARTLGFSKQDYLTASYGALYLEDCIKKKIPPSHMVFPRFSKRPLTDF